MKYMSIDIETTGLDPERHEIIEVAAIIDDLQNPKPLKELPYTTLWVRHQHVLYSLGVEKFSPFDEWRTAIASDGGVVPKVHKSHIWSSLQLLWDYHGPSTKSPIVAAGKCFDVFDRRFLEVVGCQFHRRCLDPTFFYTEPQDDLPPNMDKCLERAGLIGETRHRAYNDALDVIRLIRVAKGVKDGALLTT